MIDAPRFSIVVPVYNVGGYLEESLSSIQDQTCGDYEVVLVDDGSTDGSGELCDAWASGRGNAVVVHQENRGLLMARRIGMARAQGSYIVTLDSDDLLRSDALEVASAAIDRWDPDIVAFMFSRSRDFKPYGPSALGVAPGFYDGERYGELRRTVCAGRHNNLWSKVVRRDIVDIDADYTPHQGMTHAEDLFQLCPIVDRARSFAYVDEALYYYRPNPRSATRSYKPRQLDDLATALGALVGYADSWGGPYPELARKGALLQCSYLLHMMVNGYEDGAACRDQFDRLCSYVEAAGLFGPWQRDLRPDKRWETAAMRARAYGRARLLVRVFERVKRVRDTVAAR